MPMEIHILDVGCGNMAIVFNPDGSRYVIDCNITDDNRDNILLYAQRVLGRGMGIDVFINSHRDADHMRGIAELHSRHPINQIWDTEVAGTTIDSSEYRSYMALRRTVISKTISPYTKTSHGDATYRWMNGGWSDYSDVNQQSVVLKIEFRKPGCSVLFAGDTDFRPWKEKILPRYGDGDLKTALLIAPHHGSVSFFDDPSDAQNYYLEHIRKIAPSMTIISVGPNQHGLPDKKAIEYYDYFSSGSDKGNKVFSTEEQGHMKITLKDDGGWALSVKQ